jgi:hypothetical protein
MNPMAENDIFIARKMHISHHMQENLAVRRSPMDQYCGSFAP